MDVYSKREEFVLHWTQMLGTKFFMSVMIIHMQAIDAFEKWMLL